MKIFIFFLAFLAFNISCNNKSEQTKIETKSLVAETKEKHPFPIIVLHGGAGTVTRERLAENGLEEKYRAALDSAINLGYNILINGGTAVLAVETTITHLENHPLFNAGKGAVLNAEGRVELDASIMDGSNLMAGAVAGVGNVKNPISLARLVKDSTKHVLLSGIGAEAFAQKMQVDLVENSYFLTPKTRETMEKRIANLHKMGTVGCVAIDKNGNIAAGTSTGGMDNKQYGRIGDSPIIGAGTYAKNGSIGVSCTGHGEFFIKNVVAYNMCALFEYKGLSAPMAAKEIVQDKLLKQNALGGLVAIDANGEIAIEFNTPGMFWAYKRQAEQTKIGMYGNDEKY